MHLLSVEYIKEQRMEFTPTIGTNYYSQTKNIYALQLPRK